METYNFKDHVSGDTFYGVQFVLANQDGPINLTNAVIILKTDWDPNTTTLSTTNGGLTISNSSGGVFEIPLQKISWKAHYYSYDISINFPNGRVNTYIKGTWKIFKRK